MIRSGSSNESASWRTPGAVGSSTAVKSGILDRRMAMERGHWRSNSFRNSEGKRDGVGGSQYSAMPLC